MRFPVQLHLLLFFIYVVVPFINGSTIDNASKSALVRRLCWSRNCEHLDEIYLDEEGESMAERLSHWPQVAVTVLSGIINIDVREIALRAARALERGNTDWRNHRKFTDYFGYQNVEHRKRIARAFYLAIAARGTQSQYRHTQIFCWGDTRPVGGPCDPRGVVGPYTWTRPGHGPDLEHGIDEIHICLHFYNAPGLQRGVGQDDKVTAMFHAWLLLARQRFRRQDLAEEGFYGIMRRRDRSINNPYLFTAFAMAIHKNEPVGERYSIRERGPHLTFEGGETWLDRVA